MRVRTAGPSALLLDLDAEPSPATALRLRALRDALAASAPRGVRDLVPGFASLLVEMRPGTSARAIAAWLAAAGAAAGLATDDVPGPATGPSTDDLAEGSKGAVGGEGAVAGEGGDAAEGTDAAAQEPIAQAPGAHEPIPQEHVVPVAYGEGADRDELVARLGMGWERIVEAHAGAAYTVAFLGFTPGFPYLLGLPESLHTPRRDTPRKRVPAGSVAIAGAQAGIYPSASPGGWWILGRTGTPLFDPERWPPTTWAPGDTVRFVPAPGDGGAAARDDVGGDVGGDVAEDAPGDAAAARSPEAPAPDEDQAAQSDGAPSIEAAIEVTEAWPPSASVQAAPRWWVGHLGMAQAGALDPVAHELANHAVGNARGAAAIELVLLPLRLRAHTDLVAAVAGGGHAARLDGRPLRPGTPFRWPRGAELALVPDRTAGGATSYLAITGGVAADLVRGSRSTDLRAGLGGARAPLRAGTLLGAARPSAGSGAAGAGPLIPRNGPAGTSVRYPARVRLRVHPGPQYDPATFARLTSTAFRVSALDRTGVRLDGPSVHASDPDVLSEGSPWGAVQLPADGHPIVLLADRGRTGGYAKPAVVDVGDLWRLAQAPPGTEVWLEPAERAPRPRH